MTETSEDAPPVRSHTVTLVALLLADMVYGFQQISIIPALPTVQQDLGASREWTVWLFSGYLIVASVAPVFLGKLGDRIGQRRVYLGALVAFLLGSIATALAPNIQLVVIFRMLQGVGGVVFPLSFAIVTEVLPREKVRTAIGVLAGGFGMGSVLGLPVGGAIAEYLSWRWIFWVGAIALGIGALLVFLTVPKLGPRAHRRLDTPGALLFGGAMALLVVGITEGPQRGWLSPLALGAFALSVVTGIGWYVREQHTAEPLMDLGVLRSRGVLMTNLTSVFGGYAVFGVNLLLPFLLENEAGSGLVKGVGLAAGPLLVGLVLLPRAVGQTIGSPLTGVLTQRLGTARVFAAGMLLVAAATFALAFFRAELWAVLVELAVLGLGFGTTVSLTGSIVALAAPLGETGVATAITSVLRRAGGAVGSQVSVALLAVITLSDGSPAPAAFTTAFAVSAAVGLAGAVCAGLVFPRVRS
ncbi:MAG TPA: MFS transporter [Nocardioidaceae bacterium]|nr:MFS transporter [Nocardioidaceae bacterium]